MYPSTMKASPRRVILFLIAFLAVAMVVVSPEARADAFATAPGGERIATTPGPVGIGNRTTLVHRPESAGANAPLVILLHGKNSSGLQMQQITAMDAVAAEYGFVTAYPDAHQKLWNAGSDCCRTKSMKPVDDVAFLHDLRSQLIVEEQVDPSRIYVVGLSAGGMLTYKWACERPADITAIGVTAGANMDPCAAPGPMNVVAVHGTRDSTFPLNGGTSNSGKPIPSLDEALAPFLAANTCPTAPAATADIGRMSVSTWPCAGGRGVVRSIVRDTGHTWPGYQPSPTYPTSSADTSEFIWTRMTASY